MKRFMNWVLNRFLRPAGGATPPAPPPNQQRRLSPQEQRGRMAALWAQVLAQLAADDAKRNPPKPLKRADALPGVVPEKILAADGKAIDPFASDSVPYDWINREGMFNQNSFPGYPYLAQLSQLPEYRKIAQIIADEMTRKWIRITYKGDNEDGKDKIKTLTQCMRKHKLRSKFRHALELESYFGRCQLFADVSIGGGSNAVMSSRDPKELETPLFLDPKKIPKGSKVSFKVVEPLWSYPGVYNSNKPLQDDYYVPETWYVMGDIVHRTRLRTIISNPVPDILKAAYSFGGVSLSQLAEPYVNNWLRTRQSVSDIVHSFSTSGLSADLSALLATPFGGESGVDSEGGDIGEPFTDIVARIKLFNDTRDNRGMLLINKESEEFFQFNVPLAGLEDLQAQSQEHLCSVSGIPLVKYTGITPAGLNATSDGEIRVFYDSTHAKQEVILRDHIKYCLDILQLTEFGVVDDGIDFEFVPLYQLSEEEIAAAKKAEADRDKVYIDAGAISPQDVRDVIRAEQDGRYAMLEDEQVPEFAEEEEEEDDDSGASGPGESGSPQDPAETRRVAGG